MMVDQNETALMKSSLLGNNRSMNGIIAALFFLAACFFYFVFYENDFFYLVDDSGVEILQVRYFSGWPLNGFIQSYENDIIESFMAIS